MVRHEMPSIEPVLASGRGAPDMDRKIEFLQSIRHNSEEWSQQIDRDLLEAHARLYEGLQEAQVHQKQNLSSPVAPVSEFVVKAHKDGPRSSTLWKFGTKATATPRPFQPLGQMIGRLLFLDCPRNPIGC